MGFSCELQCGKEKGLRLVEVSSSEWPNVLEVARGCARYPRLRFIIVADHVDVPPRGNVAVDLLNGLGGTGGSGWPDNTLLYVGASSNSTIGYGDALVSRFGLVLPLTPSEGDAAFRDTLKEMVGGAEIGDEDFAAAKAWAEKHGGLSLRTAAQYVRLYGPAA